MPKHLRKLPKNTNLRGLTLIELLMALSSTLSLLIILATLLLTLQKNFNTQNSLNIIQENAHAVIQILKNAIHEADHIVGTDHELTIHTQDETDAYLTQPTGRYDNSHKEINALYVKNKVGRKSELVEGIKIIQFTYDIKTNNKITTRSANQITDWSTVVGINATFTVTHSPITKPWITYVAL